MYFGNIEFAEEAVSPRDAVIWRWNNEDYIKEVDLNILWEQRIIKLPIFEKEKIKNEVDVTEDFLEYISELAVSRILKEKNFVIWKDILRNYRLYSENDLFYFVRESKKLEVLWDITDLWILKEVVAKKEFLDWLLKFRPYFLNGTKIEKPYENFDLPTQKTTVYGTYATALRNTYFWWSKYFNLIRPGETYQPRQWKTKLYEWWITSVIAPRRWGKTMYIGERAIEEIFRDKQFFDKPVRVLVIGINKRKNKTIINYILNMSGPYIKNGYLKYDSVKESILYISKETKEKKAERVLWMIDFIGAKDEDAWVGDNADLIIIDECERIKDEIWDDVFPIVTNEWAKAILVSTLNKRSQKTWFYDNIIRGEQEELKRSMVGLDPISVINKMRETHVQPHIDSWVPYEKWIETINIDDIRKEMMMTRMWTALRFTGNDVDLTTDKEKEIARDNLRKKWDHVFFPERLGIFPDEVKTYDYEASVKTIDYFHGKKYKYGVISYDPAEKRDKAAVLWAYWDETTQKVHIRRTTQLPPNYTFHWDYLKKEIEDQKVFTEQSYFAFDNWWVWQGLEPYFNQVSLRMDMRIKFTAGSMVNKEWNLHKVSKEYLVNMVQNALEHWQIIISDECTELLWELDWYKWHYNKDTGNTKYQAESWYTDDFVSAFMIAVYFILEFMWEKFRIKKTIEQINDETNYGKISDDERNKKYLQDMRDWKIKKEDFFWWRIEWTRSDVLSKFWY